MCPITIRILHTKNVNTSPAIQVQIPIISTVFSAIARCIRWARTAAAHLIICRTVIKTAAAVSTRISENYDTIVQRYQEILAVMHTEPEDEEMDEAI